jgi:hypothetical protein
MPRIFSSRKRPLARNRTLHVYWKNVLTSALKAEGQSLRGAGLLLCMEKALEKFGDSLCGLEDCVPRIGLTSVCHACKRR